MSDAVSLLSLYDFMVWKGKAVPFHIDVSCLALEL
jgi:hypothetical protein